MKTIKRTMAFLISLVMVLAMSVTAFAAPQTQQKGKLTVQVNSKNSLKGQKISVYKLFDLTRNGDNYGYTVNDTYKETLATVLQKDSSVTSDELYEAISGLNESSVPMSVQEFANKFTEQALRNSLGATKTSEKITTEETIYVFDDLDYGYYLVYQTGTKTIQASLVSVDADNVDVNLKGETPSIIKTGDKEVAETGEVVKYTITGTIVDTTGYDEYVYEIHDKLSSGLDFVKNANGDKLEIERELPVSVQISGEGSVEVKNATLSEEGNRTMVLDLSDWVRTNQTHKGKQFTITYYAKVNVNATVIENNKAKLEFGNNPSDVEITTPVEEKTNTYPLDINKTESKNHTMLAGATFRLYKSENDAKNNVNNAIKVKQIEDGKYAIDPTETNMDMVTVGTQLDKKANLHINGLKDGDYWLVETNAPEGFNKLTNPVKVTINRTDFDNYTVNKDDVEEDDKIIDIVNSTGTLLPSTGGMGTIIFTVAGVVMILGITLSFALSRRRK